VVGHIPEDVTNIEAADSGIYSIEHANEQRECWRERPDWPAVMSPAAIRRRCAPVAQAYVRNKTWITPTIVTHGYIGWGYGGAQRFVRVMHDLGVRRFLAGSDHGVEDLPAGRSLLAEVTLLAEAGLTPLEALQAATVNPAASFNASDSL